MSVIDKLPPGVQLLVREVGQTRPKNLADYHRSFRKLFPELQRQSLWWASSQDRREWKDEITPGFVMNLAGGLDPFSDVGKCSLPSCRMKAVEDIARMVGLYADCAYVPDHFTTAFAYRVDWSIENTEWLLLQLRILRELEPLLKAGVISFSAPMVTVCNDCAAEVRSRITTAAEAVLKDKSELIQVRRDGDEIVIDSRAFDPAALLLTHELPNRKRERTSRPASVRTIGLKYYQEALVDDVHNFITSIHAVRRGTGISLSSSRALLLTLRELEPSLLGAAELHSWEAARSTDIPWIRNLDLSKLLELRESAKDALPRFRAKMAHALSAQDSAKEGTRNQLMFELREQAAEVEQELLALRLPQGARFRNLAGGLAITIAVYGFGAEFLPAGAALSGLLSTLGLIHSAARKDHQEAATLISKPGFALVKAKELLGHSHDS